MFELVKTTTRLQHLRLEVGPVDGYFDFRNSQNSGDRYCRVESGTSHGFVCDAFQTKQRFDR